MGGPPGMGGGAPPAPTGPAPQPVLNKEKDVWGILKQLLSAKDDPSSQKPSNMLKTSPSKHLMT
jgi:hypothetical protein